LRAARDNVQRYRLGERFKILGAKAGAGPAIAGERRRGFEFSVTVFSGGFSVSVDSK
jgi:hypothetical protein